MPCMLFRFSLKLRFICGLMRLSELQTGEKGFIKRISGHGAFKRRLAEMGFVRGKVVRVIKNAPLKDPIEYNILGYSVSLRRSEAELIEVSSEPINTDWGTESTFVPRESETVATAPIQKDVINVVFVGNPNSGKTTLYNALTHSNEHTGNYSGVTVDYKTATLPFEGFTLKLTDLPGTYSISAYTPEELFVRDFLVENVPDVVVNVVDVSNIERNLFLTSQLIDMDIKVVVALNMYDEIEKRGDQLDFALLGKMLGTPMVPTVGSKGRGLQELLTKVVRLHCDSVLEYEHVTFNYGPDVEKSIAIIDDTLRQAGPVENLNRISPRFVAIRLLQNDQHIRNHILQAPNLREIIAVSQEQADQLASIHNEEVASLIADAKYGYIAGAIRDTFTPGQQKKLEVTQVLDSFLTHKLFGFPIFLFFLWVMFNSTFALGEYPQRWIESGIDYLVTILGSVLAEGSLKDLLIDGIIGGVGGVIVFLPNILILFLFISFMEDSGYMARAVFILDKLMKKIGLHGKSFIPLIMGFGCNVPAIMATRTIEDKNSRLITILINPFMSCSARLPVYLLLIGAVFPDHRGSLLFLIYLAGIILAIVLALIFKKTIFKSKPYPFVLELPPYRVPTAKSVVRHMWFKGSEYLKKMSGVILLASVLMWALSYFPRNFQTPAELQEVQGLLTELQHTATASPQEIDSLQQKILQLTHDCELGKMQHSYIGRLGLFMEPIFRPLGFDWRMSVSLISGIAAKEVVVSTLGVLFQANDEGASLGSSLVTKLRQERYTDGKLKGQLIFNGLSTISFLVFTLIYFPCVAVIAAVRKETNSRLWAFFVVLYTTSLAWGMSFMVYQVGKIFWG